MGRFVVGLVLWVGLLAGSGGVSAWRGHGAVHLCETVSDDCASSPFSKYAVKPGKCTGHYVSCGGPEGTVKTCRRCRASRVFSQESQSCVPKAKARECSSQRKQFLAKPEPIVQTPPAEASQVNDAPFNSAYNQAPYPPAQYPGYAPTYNPNPYYAQSYGQPSYPSLNYQAPQVGQYAPQYAQFAAQYGPQYIPQYPAEYPVQPYAPEYHDPAWSDAARDVPLLPKGYTTKTSVANPPFLSADSVDNEKQEPTEMTPSIDNSGNDSFVTIESTQQPTANPEPSTQQPTDNPEPSTQESTENDDPSTEQPTVNPEPSTEQPTADPEPSTEQPTDNPEPSTEPPTVTPALINEDEQTLTNATSSPNSDPVRASTVEETTPAEDASGWGDDDAAGSNNVDDEDRANEFDPLNPPFHLTGQTDPPEPSTTPSTTGHGAESATTRGPISPFLQDIMAMPGPVSERLPIWHPPSQRKVRSAPTYAVRVSYDYRGQDLPYVEVLPSGRPRPPAPQNPSMVYARAGRNGLYPQGTVQYENYFAHAPAPPPDVDYGLPGPIPPKKDNIPVNKPPRAYEITSGN